MQVRLQQCVVLLVSGGYLFAGSSIDQADIMAQRQEKIAMVQGYAQLAASIVQRSYNFFTRNEQVPYDFQADVLDVPYKNMLYTSTQAIEKIFDDANLHDNPRAQIKALILLCRMPVPEWYLKSFYKGMDQLYKICFDESGNFKASAFTQDIRLIFKEYCKKTPSCWQDIARISPWWYKNKKPYALYSKYYALTCTQHNDDLLRMIDLDVLQDQVYLTYLCDKCNCLPASKIYQAHQIYTLQKSVKSDDTEK